MTFGGNVFLFFAKIIKSDFSVIYSKGFKMQDSAGQVFTIHTCITDSTCAGT